LYFLFKRILASYENEYWQRSDEAIYGGPAGANGFKNRNDDLLCWFQLCPSCRKGIVPMIISSGTFKSNAGPEGTTSNWNLIEHP
jgi:hypothetical protein